MSTFDIAFLGMVIVAMCSFLVVLAWGCWRTRGPSKVAEPVVTPAARPSESSINRRAA